MSFSLIIAALFGAVIVSLTWPNSRAYLSDIGTKICLSIGAGFGFVSCHYFINLIFFNNNENVIIAEFFLLIVMGGCYLVLHYKKIREGSGFLGNLRHHNSSVRSWFSISTGVILFLSFLWFALRSLNYPHGKSDAWGIWNMRARFLFRAADQLGIVFSNQYGWSHPDYPLMLPLNVARLWQYSGGEYLGCPIVIAFIFTAAVLGLLYFSIYTFRGSIQANLAIIVLLGIRYFIPVGAGQLADVPLAFFFLSTCILFYRYHGGKAQNKGYLFLAGFMAACAAWTKNEGQLFILSVILAILLTGFRYSRVFAAIREISVFSLGALPILAVLFIFKFGFAPPNDLISGQNYEATIARLLDINRLLIVIKYGLHYLVKALGAYIVILPLSLFLWGGALSEKDRRGLLLPALTLLEQASGYVLVYMMTPHDLNWHLSTSMSRLIVQLIPTLCFILFMVINPLDKKSYNFSGFLFKHE